MTVCYNKSRTILKKVSVDILKNIWNILRMNITKHTTFTFTLDEVKQSLLEYQMDVMSEILNERLNLPCIAKVKGTFDTTVTGLELLNWTMIMLKGSHSEEFKKIENGRWIHTPSFVSGYIALFHTLPHIFMHTDELSGLAEDAFTITIVKADGEEFSLENKVILSNI
jgi:hypothetical protein